MNTQLLLPRTVFRWLISGLARAFLFVVCLAAAASCLAAPTEVRFDVFLGYDNIVPEASWFPVTFEVHNDGPAFTGVIELNSSQYDRSQRRTVTLELPTGTTKRLVLPAFSSGRYVNSWDARLLDEKGKVRAEALALRARKQNPWQIPLSAAVTRTPPILPEIKVRQPDLQPVFARIQPGLFPDNPITLEGLNTVYLSSERALELKVNQVSALLGWLHAGGHLIVGVEQPLHVNGSEWLSGILPCQVTGLEQQPSRGALQQWLTSSLGQDQEGLGLRISQRQGSTAVWEGSNPYANLAADTFFDLAPMQTAVAKLRDGSVLVGSEERPLAIQAARGRGVVTVLLFSPELEPFVSWKHRSYFWARLSGFPTQLLASDQQNNYGAHHSSDGIFGAMIDSKQVRKLPVGWLLLLLVGYLLVIGPLDYYWLKKINRQMLTWITFPVYVVLFSALIYFIGYRLRAGETEWNELHLVDVLSQGSQAQLRGRTYASVYAPVNATYQVQATLPFASLRGEYMGIHANQEGSRAHVAQQGNSFAAEINVPVWTSQLYISDWWTRDVAPVSLSVTPQRDGWRVTIENNHSKKLSPVKLVIAGEVHEVDDLPPLETKTLTITSRGTPVAAFARQYGAQFVTAVQQRNQAFGGNRSYLSDVPHSSMAASFIGEIQPRSNYGESQFVLPPGLDLSALATPGNAVLLAWQADGAPIKPLNQFSARRGQRGTLWRLSVPIAAAR